MRGDESKLLKLLIKWNLYLNFEQSARTKHNNNNHNMFEYYDYTLSILQSVCEKAKTSTQNNMYIKTSMYSSTL